ncbi:Tetratricopeptide repeat protein OS=Streptomyces alboniger OX=132473 GN=CP975_06710 PE=4 SV=1 [Streptomyces alboniger]
MIRKTGLSRKRAAAHALDAALDDTELVSARAALAQGRWQAARALLAATGDEWDRRGHRVTVLAREPYCAAWANDWLLAEPDSADAAVLLALAQVRRALRGKEEPARAREACRSAASRAPADPTPWLGLLLLEHSLGSGDEVGRLFDEVRARHPDHHHAHHLMVARLAEHRSDVGPDPLHEVYDFAAWAAEQAPADSPLAILPVVAHAERYRVLAATGHEPPDPATSRHWTGRRARQVMKAAFDWWLEWEQEGHPRRLVDLNFLAHAKVCEGRGAEAAALFHRIGEHPTPAPWSYPDREPRPRHRVAAPKRPSPW